MDFYLIYNYLFQFYSGDCRAVFQRDVKVSITRANEQEPLCLDSHLDDDSPTRIAFSTLADRPSAEDFENSPVLQVTNFLFYVFSVWTIKGVISSSVTLLPMFDKKGDVR